MLSVKAPDYVGTDKLEDTIWLIGVLTLTIVALAVSTLLMRRKEREPSEGDGSGPDAAHAAGRPARRPDRLIRAGRTAPLAAPTRRSTGFADLLDLACRRVIIIVSDLRHVTGLSAALWRAQVYAIVAPRVCSQMPIRLPGGRWCGGRRNHPRTRRRTPVGRAQLRRKLTPHLVRKDLRASRAPPAPLSPDRQLRLVGRQRRLDTPRSRVVARSARTSPRSPGSRRSSRRSPRSRTSPRRCRSRSRTRSSTTRSTPSTSARRRTSPTPPRSTSPPSSPTTRPVRSRARRSSWATSRS